MPFFSGIGQVHTFNMATGENSSTRPFSATELELYAVKGVFTAWGQTNLWQLVGNNLVYSSSNTTPGAPALTLPLAIGAANSKVPLPPPRL